MLDLIKQQNRSGASNPPHPHLQAVRKGWGLMGSSISWEVVMGSCCGSGECCGFFHSPPGQGMVGAGKVKRTYGVSAREEPGSSLPSWLGTAAHRPTQSGAWWGFWENPAVSPGVQSCAGEFSGWEADWGSPHRQGRKRAVTGAICTSRACCIRRCEGDMGHQRVTSGYWKEEIWRDCSRGLPAGAMGP